MQSLGRREFLETSCLAAGAWLLGPRLSVAAIAPGIETVAVPLITGEEISRQPDIWGLEVRYKSMRMIQAELTDPQTKKSTRQLVWYLAYRALVRKSSRVPEATEDQKDQPIFVPEFTFVTEDEGKMETYADRVLPEALAAINKRERHKYKNSVEIVGPLPKITPDGAKTLASLDGVATWTGINPDTDFFTVYMAGFSNGYKISKGPDGQEIALRRTLMQKFWRPSDRYEQHENEIRQKGDPEWIYR